LRFGTTTETREVEIGERRTMMSWWSDKEPFDEHDPDYCKNCKGGNSYEECKRCAEWHDEEVYDEAD
jgi:hypothetical protein